MVYRVISTELRNTTTAAVRMTNIGDVTVVTPTGLVIATDSYSRGIVAENASQRIEVAGTVAGRNDGISIGGSATDCTAIVHAGGLVSGNSAIWTNSGSTIVNAGTLSGRTAVFANLQPVDITNTGTIAGVARGITVVDGGRITNFGTITGFTAIEMTGGSIDNRGSITGNLVPSLDDDVVESSGGSILGIVWLGLGNDSFTGGVLADTVAGEAGLDALSGGGGNDVILGDMDFDVLTGGAGRDRFDFDNGLEFTALVGSGFDPHRRFPPGLRPDRPVGHRPRQRDLRRPVVPVHGHGADHRHRPVAHRGQHLDHLHRAFHRPGCGRPRDPA